MAVHDAGVAVAERRRAVPSRERCDSEPRPPIRRSARRAANPQARRSPAPSTGGSAVTRHAQSSGRPSGPRRRSRPTAARSDTRHAARAYTTPWPGLASRPRHQERPMAERSLRTLLEGGSFFEGPRWHEGRWWVADFYRHLVLTVDPEGGTGEVLVVEEQPSGLGWMPDGSLLVVSMRDHRILRWSPEAGVTVHADVSQHCGGHLNDMVVDRHGRAYAGNFGFDLMGGADPAPATLIRVDPDGAASVAAEAHDARGDAVAPAVRARRLRA